MRSTHRFDSLTASMHGPVILPGDDLYDTARRIWNGDIDQRPAAIARCKDENDVATAVRFGVAEGLEISVRGGGHSFPGLSVRDDALMLDLSGMRAVSELAGSRFVAQGGALLGDLDRLACRRGRIVPSGVVSHTGVGGLTLGGGTGYLSRRWGLTCDSLRSVRLVQADGEIVTVTDEFDPELMWGMRGGGGNWGVVTEFEFDSFPLRDVLAGWLVHPHERARDFVDFYRDFASTMPRELCVLLRLKLSGEAPFLAPDLSGAEKSYVAVFVVWSGSSEDGEAALAPLRNWGGVSVHDDIRVQPFSSVQSSLDGLTRHGVGRYERAGYLSEITDGVLDSSVPSLIDAPSMSCDVSLFSLGGAVGDVDEQATAYSSRSAAFLYEVRTAWIDPAERPELVAWTRDVWTGINAHAMPGVYVNLVMDEGPERVRSSYGEAKFQRLGALKARVDPDNAFHLNQNVTPAVPVTLV